MATNPGGTRHPQIPSTLNTGRRRPGRDLCPRQSAVVVGPFPAGVLSRSADPDRRPPHSDRERRRRAPRRTSSGTPRRRPPHRRLSRRQQRPTNPTPTRPSNRPPSHPDRNRTHLANQRSIKGLTLHPHLVHLHLPPRSCTAHPALDVLHCAASIEAPPGSPRPAPAAHTPPRVCTWHPCAGAPVARPLSRSVRDRSFQLTDSCGQFGPNRPTLSTRSLVVVDNLATSGQSGNPL